MASAHQRFPFADGSPDVLLLSAADVRRLLDPGALIDALATGFGWLELGEVTVPPRLRLGVGHAGYSLAMPAWRDGLHATVKVVNVFDGNHAHGLPSHHALISLFDADTGAPRCIMDGATITAMRTAGAAMLSVRMASRTDARVATVVGAGVQAREHLHQLRLVRALDRINLWSRNSDHTRALAAQLGDVHAVTDLEAAVGASDIVCLTTSAATPVIDAAWVRPGTHVCSVGFQSTGGELPRELAMRARLFVESLDAFRPAPVGSGELAGMDAALGTTLGAVALGRSAGRVQADEVTVYKAMGNAMEDLIAANLVYRAAVGLPGSIDDAA